jgi:hypothetical protein
MPQQRKSMTPERLEARRKKDRENLAAKRAAMTAEERAERRREDDRLYRERHREERRESQRSSYRAEAERRWNAPDRGSSPDPDAA